MRRITTLAICSCVLFHTFLVSAPGQTLRRTADINKTKNQKKKGGLEQNLNLLYSHKGRAFQDPFLPVFIYGLKRLLAGTQNPSQIDRIVQDNLKRHPRSRKDIEHLVKNWDAIPSQIKAKHFSKEFVSLDPKEPLDLKLFGGLASKTISAFDIPRSAGPVSFDFASITPPPRINDASPAGPDWVLVLRPGEPFTLTGERFSATASENRIQIGRERVVDGVAEFVNLFELTPTSATTRELRAIAPESITRGTDYFVRVITNGQPSNRWSTFVELLPGPTPMLESVEPSCQYPGQRVLLTGSNFTVESIARLAFLAGDPGRARIEYYLLGPPHINFISPNQIELLIPQNVWPGDYRIAVSNRGDAATSLYRTFTVCAPQYHIQLEEIYCFDESDSGLFGESGTDDIMGIFNGISDNRPLITVATDEISGFEDRVRRSFGPTGPSIFSNGTEDVPIQAGLAFLTMLMENDSYSREEAVSWARQIGAFVDETTSLILGLVGASAAATGAAGIIAATVAAAVLIIMAFDNAPDLIGNHTDVFSAVDLQTRTAANSDYTFTNTVEFHNPDDVGSYSVTYRVYRREPVRTR